MEDRKSIPSRLHDDALMRWLDSLSESLNHTAATTTNRDSYGEEEEEKEQEVDIKLRLLALGRLVFGLPHSSLSADSNDINFGYADLLSKLDMRFEGCTLSNSNSNSNSVNSKNHSSSSRSSSRGNVSVQDMVVLEGLLICSVSEACDSRALFVQHIMMLNHEDQVIIMHMIRSNMRSYIVDKSIPLLSPPPQSHTDDSNNNDSNYANFTAMDKYQDSSSSLASSKPSSCHYFEDNSRSASKSTTTCASENLYDHTSSSGSSSSCSSSNSKGVSSNCNSTSSATCKRCDARYKTIEKVKSDIVSLRQELISLDHSRRFDLQKLSQNNIDLELEILQKESSYSDQERKLQSMSSRIKTLERYIIENQKLIESFQQISDEIEIIRPVAEKSLQLEETVRILHLKLNELNDIKSRLAAESSKNSDAYSKLLLVEQEVEVLRGYKLQLESYEKQFEDLYSSSEEMKSRILLQDKEIKRLKSEKARLIHGQSSNFDDNHLLLLELSAKQDKLNNISNGAELDDDSRVSEVNPELMKELKSLRHENSELAILVNETSLENLENMQIILNGHYSENSALQQWLMNVKDDTSKAVQKIASLDELMASISREFHFYRKERAEYSKMVTEDQNMKLLQHRSRCNLQGKQFEAVSSLISKTHSVLNSDLNSVIKDNDMIIQGQVDEIKKFKSEIYDIDVDISNLEQRKLELSNQNAMNLIDFDSQLDRTESEGNLLIGNLKRNHSETLSRLELSFLATMDSEKTRCAALESELEDEKSKKRRLERDKRVAESEAQRHKAMIQSNPNSSSSTTTTSSSSSSSSLSVASMSGNEIDAMIKELRGLQDELESLKSENFSLKARDSFRLGKLTGNGNGDKPINNISSMARSKIAIYGHDGKGLITKPQRGASMHTLGDSADYSYSNSSSTTSSSSSTFASSSTIMPFGRLFNSNNDGNNDNSNEINDDNNGYGMATCEYGNICNNTEGSSSSSNGYFSYELTGVDMADKRVDQLLKEKRELLAKSLEESKTKAGLSQKLAMCEKEVAALKGKITKSNLEKERLERKISKLYEEGSSGDLPSRFANENIINK